VLEPGAGFSAAIVHPVLSAGPHLPISMHLPGVKT
jgi:hypothetical protein